MMVYVKFSVNENNYNNWFYLILILFLFFLDEEIYDNENFHSEEQDELEIPNGK